MKYSHIAIWVVVGVFIGGFVVNTSFFKNILSSKSTVSDISENHEGGGQLINPLLECLDVGEGDHIQQLNISRFKLNDYVDKIVASKKADSLSVYVRDLNNGPWVGINEKEEFLAGSLLKLPILISFMKLGEEEPSIFEKQVEYKKEIVSDKQFFPPLKEIEVGKSYSVKDLLEYMIYYSDNNAAALLVSGLTQKEIDETFTAIGLGSPSYAQNYPINTKTYAGFFRILFNASYLNKSFSEATLNILTRTDFKAGITALLPKNITVAHKFGIRTVDGVNQLHDCGIVYYPKHPYIVCIMTKGKNFDDLAGVIAKISKFVYDQIDQSL